MGILKLLLISFLLKLTTPSPINFSAYRVGKASIFIFMSSLSLPFKLMTTGKLVDYIFWALKSGLSAESAVC
jgi:hypothetical protein